MGCSAEHSAVEIMIMHVLEFKLNARAKIPTQTDNYMHTQHCKCNYKFLSQNLMVQSDHKRHHEIDHKS